MLFTTECFAPLRTASEAQPAPCPSYLPPVCLERRPPFSQAGTEVPRAHSLSRGVGHSVGGQEALPSRPQMMISEHKEEPHTHCDGLTGAELWPWGFWLYFPTAFRVFLKMNHVHKKEKKKKLSVTAHWVAGPKQNIPR